ncbi:hypothetical protein [Pseudomonas knackmussii]|uniref:hypothetical protein n=1 Tax=Pseudomonas knackmussii TaxID=65741 RepID=UPI0012EB948E|nr:hypothetical protein [Pseudomonas knackmussii]
MSNLSGALRFHQQIRIRRALRRYTTSGPVPGLNDSASAVPFAADRKRLNLPALCCAKGGLGLSSRPGKRPWINHTHFRALCPYQLVMTSGENDVQSG